MEFLLDTQIAAPFFQVALLLVLITLALLFGQIKLALIITYCFTLYWGFVLNVSFFSDKGTLVINNYFYLFAYLGFGLLIVILAVIGFFINE